MLPSHGLTSADARARLEQYGPNDVPERRVHPVLLFVRKFWGASAGMLEAIAALSFILHKQADFWIVLALLVTNAVISFLQEQRASSAVAALRRRLQVTSRVLRDGRWQLLPAGELVPGDVVRVRTGDFVPADAQVLDGELRVDQSALTGESQELERTTNALLYSGSIARSGEATAIVTATGLHTYFGRTTALVAGARPTLHVEEVVGRMVRWLLVIVGVQLVLALGVAIREHVPLVDVLPLSLVVLMGAIPVALPVMFTVSMALGAKALARQGILVSRLSAAEDAATMDVVCADKTGTLTMNQLALVEARPQPGITEDALILDGALASHEADQDPIDLAFLRAARDRHLLDDAWATRSFVPFSPATRRTEALVERAGVTRRVVKGALRTVAGLAGMDDTVLRGLETRATEDAQRGLRTLAVASGDHDGPLRLLGVALLADPVRADSRRLLDELRSLGVSVKMLTGDALPVAQAIAGQLGLGEIVRAPELRAEHHDVDLRTTEMVDRTAGVAEVFPEDKFRVVRALQSAGHVVGMTGDGVNDAPALRQAEVGIAVSGATDVAKGAASVVLTREGLACIVDLVKNGRAIYQRVLTWVINKVSRTILKTGFVVIPFLVTGRFVISALGMVVLVFMTDFVKITLATDRVRPSQNPETWKIGPLVRLAVVLGVVMLAESLALLAIGWHRFGLAANDGRLQTFAFLTLLFFALFSLVSIRERRPFWASRPSRVLAVALLADCAVGVSIGALGAGELAPLPPPLIALVVAYAAACCLTINDALKLALLPARWKGQDGGSSR
ncbi:MAG TPA: plasma-membrane proton-efflux P-type ATPase [Vicinamibacterales bacterium]|nr:plasma-membrane proton-efflux P-type ATPase [Vicinamibacterales bacterium]